jgi:hypothetical protein
VLLLHYDLAFVEYGPVPPHERSWRHPSELAAAEQAALRAEPVPPALRWFAITTGSVGLVAIAVLVLTVSPSRSSSPVAMSATTAPASAAALDQLAPTIAAVRRPSVVATTAGIGVMVRALATPIGAGDYAVVSTAAIAGHDASSLSVVLPSGRLATAQLVEPDDESSGETALIVLDHAEPGRQVSEHRPKDREVVTIMSSPPITVAYADIASLDVEEGTAVIDESGGLVGLCSDGDDGHGTKVLAIDAQTRDDIADHTADDTDVAAGTTVADTSADTTVQSSVGPGDDEDEDDGTDDDEVVDATTTTSGGSTGSSDVTSSTVTTSTTTSTVTNTTVTNSTVTNTTVTNSTVTKSTVTASTVTRSSSRHD